MLCVERRNQWVLLFGLGGLVILLYRQLAYVLRLKDSGTERDGLAVGAKAAAFDYAPANDSMGLPLRFDPIGQWSLLVFADPGCESCRNTVVALGRITPKLRQVTRVLVVTHADPALIATVEAFRDTAVDVGRVDFDMSIKLYNTHTTPFAYLIDSAGVIRAKGIAGDEAMIRKITHKADRSAIEVVSSAS